MSKPRPRDKLKRLHLDLTPLVDVVFQLLVFFMLCTRFATDERNHTAELPQDEGLENKPSLPKEQITIYCNWDPPSLTNSYLVAIGARGRRPVADSHAGLRDVVVYPSDNNDGIRKKQAKYTQIFNSLVASIEQYIISSGAKIEKLEISFAKDATQGAGSGTAPWMFVSLAIDACGRVNIEREKAGKPALPVTFKFVDALGKFKK